MKKYIFILIVALFAACTGKVTEYPENIITDIPSAVPTIPGSMNFNYDDYNQSVVVEFKQDTVLLTSLPQGVTAAACGARIAISSSLPGIEFVLCGTADEASFELYSKHSPLITFDGLSLFSRERAAVVVTSPSTVFLRGAGESVNYIMDGTPGVEPVNAKKAAAVQINGTAVMCDGNIALRGERKAAFRATGYLLVDGANLSVEMARADGVVADSGVLVKRGDLNISSWKDAIKSKAGNVILLDGNMVLNGMGQKGDAMQARNILLYGGNMSIDVKGDAARGLNSKGAVYIFDGKLNVTASGGAIFSAKKTDYSSSACIKSETNFYMSGGVVTLNNYGTAGKGINCNGLMQVDDGVLIVCNRGNDIQHSVYAQAHSSAKGIKCDSTMLIKGGRIEVAVLGKGQRCEGIEAKYDMILRGDDTSIAVYAYDDAINAGENLFVEGGDIYAYSEANDAIDSNGTIEICGGRIFACGSNSPEQGIDVDVESLYSISGGSVMAVGGTIGSIPCLPKSRETSQAVYAMGGMELLRVKYVAITNSDGNIIAACRLPRSMQNVGLLFSSPELQVGGEYMLFVTDSLLDTEKMGNTLYVDGTVSGIPHFAWKQGGIISVVNADGSLNNINPDTIKVNNMMPPPPGFEDKGPMPPFGGKGMMPPPPSFEDKGPMPPFGGKGIMPPPPGNIDSLMRIKMQRYDEGYNAGNLPWQEC